MSRRNILLTAVIIVAVLALVSVILGYFSSPSFAHYYAMILQILSLFVGFILALKVAGMYNKDLKMSFIFLGLFLLLYTISSIVPFWQFMASTLGGVTTLTLINILQILDYAMLIISCIFTLRVIQIKRINRYGWIVMGALLILCLYIIVRGAPEVTAALSTSIISAIQVMVIRVFDMGIILMLVPVLLLYMQHLKSRAQESITFTFIMGGVIWSLLSTYIFELVLGISSNQVAMRFFQTGSWLDVVYIFGYLIIAVGLYANMKYDEWGFRAIEKALG